MGESRWKRRWLHTGLIAAMLVLFLFHPQKVYADIPSMGELVEDGYIFINSEQEGIYYIEDAMLTMRPSLKLCYNPEEVDGRILADYLYSLTREKVGIYDYSQMMYQGFQGAYSDNCLYVDFEWKLTREQEQLFDATVALLAPYLVGATQYDTIKNVHDWICNTVEYDYDTVIGKASRHSGYNALFEHLAVCDGYATLFQKYMEKMGILCYVVTGDNHAWNIVFVNGQWYQVDCTWDDQSFGIIYDFFMI